MKKKYVTIGLLFWMLAIAMMAAPVFAEEDDSLRDNGIPIVLIEIDETGDNPTIEQMNQDEKHETRCVGTVQIITPEGFTSEYGGSAPTEKIQLEYIRGRGNSTWMSIKKPYKIKFAKQVEGQTTPLTGKQDLFGMGKSREWALMANANDGTLMKNHITSWLGQEIGMDYTSQMIPVDVYMQGTDTPREYLGSYNLSELVQVEKSRVNIAELDEDEVDNVTGGYLMSLYSEYQNSDEPESTLIRINDEFVIINKEPSYDDQNGLTEGQEAQRAYIINYIQELHDLIMTPEEDFTQDTHDQIASMMDLTSAADYWLIQEFSINGDAYLTSSTYLYKEKDGKLYWGPLWDFDISWDNEGEGIDYDEEPPEGFNHTTFQWFEELRQKDPEFDRIIQERWRTEISPALEELTETKIDEYKGLVAASQQADYEIWSQMEEANVSSYEDYDARVERLKSYINSRRKWMDDNIDNVGKLSFYATFMADGQEVGKVRVKAGRTANIVKLAEPPVLEGRVFNNWYEQESNTPYDEFPVNDDTTFVADYVDENDPRLPTGLYFSLQEDWKPLSSEKIYIHTATVYPQEAIARNVRYTVSDESVASFNDNGELVLHDVGDVTITARLYNGLTTSYLLHIYDSEVTPPAALTGVEPDAENIVMTPGQVEQIKYTLLPKNQPLDILFVSFESSDQSIVDVTDEGIMIAVSPGTATVTIKAHPEEETETGLDEPVEATFTVTVKEDESTDPVDPDDGEAETFTIKYDLNGGTLDGKTGVMTEQHKKGEVITVKDAPTRMGYIFQYWEGSKYYPGDKYTVTEDHTLKAVWAKNSGTAGSGTSTSGKTSSTTSGSSASKNTASSKTGDQKEFMIWYLLLAVSGALMLTMALAGKARKA